MSENNFEWLNGFSWKMLETEEQAFVRKLMREGKARVVNGKVELIK